MKTLPNVMNLMEMQKRLTDMIAENTAHGNVDRNFLPMVVEVVPPERKYRQRYKQSKFFPVKYVCSGRMVRSPEGGGRQEFLTITTREDEELV